MNTEFKTIIDAAKELLSFLPVVGIEDGDFEEVANLQKAIDDFEEKNSGGFGRLY